MAEITEKKARLLDNWAAEISVMPLKEQLLFMDKLFTYVSDSAKDKLLTKAATKMNPKLETQKIERWMETRFKKDHKQTPRSIASQAMNFMNISTRMAPVMIKIAQKVKSKLRMRRNRQKDFE